MGYNGFLCLQGNPNACVQLPLEITELLWQYLYRKDIEENLSLLQQLEQHAHELGDEYTGPQGAKNKNLRAGGSCEGGL